MGIAIIAHRYDRGVSECAWYLVVYLMDCTLGITLAILFHRLMHRAARWRHTQLVGAKDRDYRGPDGEHPWTEALLESGNYGDPPIMRRWAIQAAGWVTCVVSARLSVGAAVLSSLALLAAAARRLDTWFGGRVDAELFTVMVGIPMLLNVGQAWIQDQVLKWTARRRIKRGGGGDSGGGSSDSPPPAHSSAVAARPNDVTPRALGAAGASLEGGLQVLIAAAGGGGRSRGPGDKESE
ncbi:hypothetical protein HYH03_000273 [Edaphochlamys debaryana]|uniref:Uncharacterized protein n=1 Tax=Edaphochlamys debaryana TaxID=47281 RepID=A0A835YID2_9CHLO|nr:hypothetical protein HYH03_000273 [Edaphochlamys debaryana]|eukprot:KAG2501773.1 hypothetical protein HYH03_000273 [Edaphochlamys debaryana]